MRSCGLGCRGVGFRAVVLKGWWIGEVRGLWRSFAGRSIES